MNPWIWALILIAAVWAAHWGAEHLANPLKKLRKQWGFSVAAGGALVGLAAASPEIGINVASAATGVADIGLGTMFGSNVIAIPLMVMTAYIATRHLTKENADEGHGQHVQEHLLKVDRTAVTVQAIPYLMIVAVVAILTVPKQWRGLQPIDGWIMLGMYMLYLAQALLRGKQDGERVEWKKKEIYLAVAGLVALGLGAVLTVRATENIVTALGMSKIVGGPVHHRTHGRTSRGLCHLERSKVRADNLRRYKCNRRPRRYPDRGLPSHRSGDSTGAELPALCYHSELCRAGRYFICCVHPLGRSR